MGREEASLSPPFPGKHRRSPDDDAGEASPKRRRRHHHSHCRHRHRHGENGDMDEEEGEAARLDTAVAAKEGEDDIEEGEILDEGAAAAMDTERAPDAEAEPVSGALAPAPEHANNADPNLNIDANESHASWLASDPSQKDDFLIKKWKSGHAAHEPENGVICSSDRENNKGNEPNRRMSRSPRSKREKERKHQDADLNDTKVRARLRYPVSQKGVYVTHHGQDNEHHARSYKDSHMEDYSRRSPYSRRCGEAHSRDRLSHANRESSSHANRSQTSVRDDSEHENDDRCSELDRYSNRRWNSERGGYKERERSSSRIGCDGRTDIRNSQERHWDDRRHGSSLVENGRVDSHGVACRDKGRSSSYSRSDRRGSAHHGHGEGSDKDRRNSSTRHIHEERRRDTSRDSYKETDRVDSRREREKLTSDRNKRRYRDKEMGACRAREGSDSDGHKDSMHANYAISDGHKDRPRSRNKGREANHRRKRPEEVKEDYYKEEDEEDYQEKIEQQLAKQEEDDPEKIKEEARKRTEAILEKHRQRQLRKQQQESVPCNDSREVTLMDWDAAAAEVKDGNSNGLMAKEEIENNHELSNVYVGEKSSTVGKSPTQPNIPISMGISGNERTTGVSCLGEGTPMSERSADIFCDDIFGESPVGVRKLGKKDGLLIEKNALRDNWDDVEGYYTYRLGEVLDGRYEIAAGHGKGVFSTVVRAKDLKAGKDDPEEVAIKIIRNNETMYKAGKQEVSILERLASADREDKRHCVRFISNFMYRNHLCLVFESLHMNLREVLKKFGRNIGLKLTAVRAYSKQLFIALKHLKNCKVLHCDIKPDNMLVNEAKNLLKLCDFGSAMSAGMNEITPYLVSRFYRAPEIILGLPYDHPLDMWSVGCCLYELYTGKVLFPGPSNNDMLRLHMELKGPFPKKRLRKAAFTMQHFDQDLNFHAIEEDPMTKMAVKRLLLNIKPKDVGSLISSFPGEDLKILYNFKDLLEKIFVLDPEKRLTVSQALSHPFITGK